MPLWQIDIYPADNEVDREAIRTTQEIAELGLGDHVGITFARGFLVQGDFAARIMEILARKGYGVKRSGG